MVANLSLAERCRLVDTIEARAMVAMYAAAPEALELTTESFDGATVLLAPRVPVSFFNRVIGLGVGRPASERSIDEIMERFGSVGVADYWVHLNPVAEPSQLADWLVVRGFTQPPRHSWAKFLRDATPDAAEPGDIRVRLAESADALVVAQLVCTVYGLPSALAPWFAALVARPSWRVLVAEIDGKLAATGSVFIDGTTAWLGIGATLSEYRKRGAQTALLAARIEVAARAGAELLTTETGESIAGEENPSLNNIRKAGFAQVCSRLNYAAPR